MNEKEKIMEVSSLLHTKSIVNVENNGNSCLTWIHLCGYRLLTRPKTLFPKPLLTKSRRTKN